MNALPPVGEPPLKHSGLGIASFALVLIFGLVLLAVFGYAGYLEASTPGGVDEQSPEAIFAGLLMIFSIVMVFVSLALGFAGLFVGKRKRLFAVLGLCLSGFLILMSVSLFVLGAIAA